MKIPERCALTHALINVCLLTAVLLALPGDVCGSLWAQESYTGPEGYLDDLFILKSTKTSRISSYDRTGGNHDWIDIAPGETKILAEFPGPVSFADSTWHLMHLTGCGTANLSCECTGMGKRTRA